MMDKAKKEAGKLKGGAVKPFVPNTLAAVRGLSTVRDFLRYAVSCFNQADLFYGHGTFTPYDEAAYLVLEGLKLPIDQLEPYLDARLLPTERKRLAGLIRDRVVTKKPLPYLLNRAYLQGVPFYVDERVIIPRSYIAELLFDQVSGQADFTHIPDPDAVLRILDLCTGSGCLAILAAHLFPDAEVDAVDLSKDALAVAKINVAESMHAERINLFHGDLFAPLKGRKYDLIITNPPYVDAEDMTDMPAEYGYEPRMALAAGDDGLEIVHRILKEAPEYMNEGAKLICELGNSTPALEAAYPDIDFMWADTENSAAEVFWLDRDQLAG